MATAVDYGSSMIVAKSGSSIDQGDGTDVSVAKGSGAVSKPDLCSNINLGKRIPSVKVLNQADARPWHFQERLKSNGRWRLVVFPGDLTDRSSLERLNKLGKKLNAPDSFIHRYTEPGKPVDSLIEVLTVHSGKRTEFELLDMADIFHPWTDQDGWDYWKVFVDDESYHEGDNKAYEFWGIDKKVGCGVIIRPDQYVSWIGDVDDYANMDTFFSGFMKVPALITANGDVTQGTGAL